MFCRAEWTDPNEDLAPQWFPLAEMDSEINGGYHSVALSLPDGRVLAAGGVGVGSQEAVANTARAQVFSPPYLFWGPRPRAIAFSGFGLFCLWRTPHSAFESS